MGHEALRETMDVVLWQLDPEYRRRVKQNTRQHDRSLGASRRRRRLLRRLKQTDFAPTITEREIRRIEAQDVEQIHRETQDAFARRLKVAFSDIACLDFHEPLKCSLSRMMYLR